MSALSPTSGCLSGGATSTVRRAALSSRDVTGLLRLRLRCPPSSVDFANLEEGSVLGPIGWAIEVVGFPWFIILMRTCAKIEFLPRALHSFAVSQRPIPHQSEFRTRSCRQRVRSIGDGFRNRRSDPGW